MDPSLKKEVYMISLEMLSAPIDKLYKRCVLMFFMEVLMCPSRGKMELN